MIDTKNLTLSNNTFPLEEIYDYRLLTANPSYVVSLTTTS